MNGYQWLQLSVVVWFIYGDGDISGDFAMIYRPEIP